MLRKNMRLWVPLLAVLSVVQITEATWSIILADVETGEVAVGTVTCLNNFDLLALVPVVVVGKGGGAVQSAGDFNGIRRPIIFEHLGLGTPPEEILEILAGISGHQQRQYGITDTQGRKITFSGSSNGAYAAGVTGSQCSMHYAIQGNVLAGACVIDAIEQAILDTEGDIPAKLMAGMQAARSMGGDGRCSCVPFDPTSCGCPVPAFTKSGHIGGMVVARIGDVDDFVCNAGGCADGDYFMRFNVAFQGNSQPDPVLQLQVLFDAWRSDLEGRPDAVQSTVAFDPPSIPPDGSSTTTMNIALLDWQSMPISGEIQSLTVVHAPDSAGLSTIGEIVDNKDGTFSVTITAGMKMGVDRFRVAIDDGIRPVILTPDPVLEYCTPPACELDCNNNGVVDSCDIGDGVSGDCNGNGVPDECDIGDGTSEDCNTNSIPDECEPDCNDNGQADSCDIVDGTSEDCTGNGVPDECEPDCNENGQADSCDIADSTSADCNDNSVPDECDVAEGTAEDCNGNAVPDECDVGDGTSEDCNTNGVPDECEPDCNENGQADSCDIADGTSEDCVLAHDCCEVRHGPGCSDPQIEACVCAVDPFCCIVDWDGQCASEVENLGCGSCSPLGNGVPDECDIADGTSEDCTGNGVPDECEPDCNENGQADSCDIADGTSDDNDADGIPDECILVFALDIKPGSCPNPFNRQGNGVLPVALVGTVEFDPTEVDLSTLQLSRADGVGGSVAPNEGPPGPHSVFEDAATPFDGKGCECHDLGGDGIDDLSMKFKTRDLVDALELDEPSGGAAVELVLSGNLLDGTPFVAGDCIVIVPPGEHGPINATVGSNVGDTFIGATPLDLDIDSDGFTSSGRAHYPGTLLTVTAPPTSEGRRFVRSMVDGDGNDIIRVDMGCFEHQLCPADSNGDGAVGPFDLALLLGNWGPNPGHPADFDGDGTVDAADLALLLGKWGPCL